jgi:hypothetical protein
VGSLLARPRNQSFITGRVSLSFLDVVLSSARSLLCRSTGRVCVLAGGTAAGAVLLLMPASPAAWGAIAAATVLVLGETVAGITVEWMLDRYRGTVADAKRHRSSAPERQAELNAALREYERVAAMFEPSHTGNWELRRRIRRAKRRVARAEFEVFRLADLDTRLQSDKRRWLQARRHAPWWRSFSRSASIGIAAGPGVVAVWRASSGSLAVTASVAIVVGAARTASGEHLNAINGALLAVSDAYQLLDDPDQRAQAGRRVDELLVQARNDYRIVVATRVGFVGTLGGLVAVGITRYAGADLTFQVLACIATVVTSLFGAMRSALEEVDLPSRPDPRPIEFL